MDLDLVRRLFLDTAPIIYFVERNPHYVTLMRSIFQRVAQRNIQLVTSPITLAESLVHPLRNHDAQAVKLFRRAVIHGHNTTFCPIDEAIAERAADLRAIRY